MSRKVFEGVKVAEFAWIVVGPMTSRYLADHGATVVRIESHSRLDFMRTLTPFTTKKPGIDTSMAYGRYNANKYSVSIDLNHPNGQKLALKFIMWADIVTESFTPKVMKKWGLDYESVRKLRPDIIYLSSSMQGQEGPHANYAALGPHACALCGFTEISGWPDRMAAAPYGPYTDFIAPRFNAAAMIAALEYRRRTGKGQWIEQSQFEASLHFLCPPIMDYLVNGRIAKRKGNRLRYAAPHGIFPCKGDDCWVAIAVFTDEEWRAFCSTIGNPEWTKRTGFATLERRKENEDELEKLVGEWTINYTADHVEAMLQAAGVVANRLAKPSDVFEDPQLEHRNYFVRLEHPEMGRPAFESLACYILSKTPRELTMPSPCLGEHNAYVFKELLGMTDDEIADHIVDGSITTELPGGAPKATV
jgi:benzylsuccinate CoA-transferase BbsF subunit